MPFYDIFIYSHIADYLSARQFSLCAQCVILGATVVGSCFLCCCQSHPLIFPPLVLCTAVGRRVFLPLHLTLYTLHQKNRPKKRFFLLNSKKCITFAVAMWLAEDININY